MGVEDVLTNVCAPVLNCSARTLYHVAECDVLQKVMLQNRLQNSKKHGIIRHYERA